MTLSDSSHLPQVRAQYEALPYPPRNPADESKRLIRTWLDALPMLNHHGFAGGQSFGQGFRVLVAGGGTGDGTIFLAEQLRATDAQIVHLDFSEASLSIAQQRARQRGLNNIQWLHRSLLDLPGLGLAPFDYINCSGVLHHLADPDAGLRALLSVLADDGVLGLMVYARIGRIGVYQLQQALRLMHRDGAHDLATQIAHTKDLLAHLPRSNWFVRAQELHHDHKMGDAGLYDLLLHSTDRAYSVDELYDWLADQHGLHLSLTDVGRGAAPYDCGMVLGPRKPALLAELAARPLRERQAMAELLGGTLITHSLYATRQPDRLARYGDTRMVPFFVHEPISGPELSAMIHRNTAQPLVMDHSHSGFSFQLDAGQYVKFILKFIDGERSFGQVFDLVRGENKFRKAPPDDAALFADFEPLYRQLSLIERILLRRQGVTLPAMPRG